MPPTSERLKDFRKNKVRKEIYFSKQEIAEFEKVAATENLNTGVVIRNMALAYLQKRPALNSHQKRQLDSVESELTKLTFLVRNIANNVNQIARHSNRVDSLVNEYELLEHLKALDQEVERFVSINLRSIK